MTLKNSAGSLNKTFLRVIPSFRLSVLLVANKAYVGESVQQQRRKVVDFLSCCHNRWPLAYRNKDACSKLLVEVQNLRPLSPELSGTIAQIARTAKSNENFTASVKKNVHATEGTTVFDNCWRHQPTKFRRTQNNFELLRESFGVTIITDEVFARVRSQVG